jgi:hypothetical protein
VQLHLNGPHLLRDLLTTEVSESLSGVEAEIGYPQGTESREDTSYILKVLFGTTKMQARNFLAVLMKDYQEKFNTSTMQAAARAFNGR